MIVRPHQRPSHHHDPDTPAPDAAIHLTRDVRAELASAHVGIVGCGGLGSNVAWMLVRSGVRRLTLADFDRVEDSNLNRQFYFRDQVGVHKAEALSENLRRIEPSLELTLNIERIGAENLAERYHGVDVLVEALDTAAGKAEIMSTAGRLMPDTPLVAGSGLAGYAPAEQVLPHRMGDKLWIVGDMVSDVSLGLPLFASRVTIAAAHQAHLVIRLLLGLER